jgi:hypothetical protein
VPSLNRYNIYKTSFVATVGFIVLSFFGILALSIQGSTFLKVILIYGTVPAALLTFVFGLLTRITRPWHPKERERSAIDKANRLLEEIAQSKAGACLVDPSVGVVRVAELVKACEHPLSHTWVGRFEELHELVPAYLLPRSYGESNGALLDWHKYDLCIIAAGDNVRFAKIIKRQLTRERPGRGLRIYVDETGGMLGVEQERFIRRVFYGASWNCLALLSIHAVHDPRKKSELNQAMQRAQQLDSHTYSNYLMPVPVDKHGLEYMRRDAYLKKYVENLRVATEDRRRLFDEIVEILLDRLGPPVDPSPSLPGDTDPEPPKRFVISLSFPGEHRPFVKAVANELKQSLSGKEVFYVEDYAYELARPDMDTYLQSIYLEQSKLVVVFLCAEYADKQWCGLEWRAVRELIKKKQSDTIMPIRFDDTHIHGLFSIDGYVNAKLHTPEEIADLIKRRLSML